MMAVLFMGCTKEFREHREELRLLRPLYGKTYDSLILTKDATPVIFPADFQFKLKVGEPEKRRQSAGYFAMSYGNHNDSFWLSNFDLEKVGDSFQLTILRSNRTADYLGPLFKHTSFQPNFEGQSDGSVIVLSGTYRGTIYRYEFRQ